MIPPADNLAIGQRGRDAQTSLPALCLFLAGQLAVLAFCFADLRLAAKSESTARPLAMQIMLITQIATSGALFPELLATWRTALIALALGFPFTQSAAWLAGVSGPHAILASGIIALWLVGLTCWPGKSPRSAAIITLWTLGTPILYYVAAEFSPNPSLTNAVWQISPTLLVGQFPGSGSIFILLTIHAVLAGLAAALQFANRRHAV